MCLEFLCSWCHQDEDGPEHHRPQSQHTVLPAGSEPPSKLPINGTEIRKGEYPAQDESPSRPRSEPSINGTDTWNGDPYPERNDPPSKPRTEAYNKNQVVSGVAVNRDTMRKDENPKTTMAFNGEKGLKAVHPGPYASVPHVRNNTVLAAPVHQPNLRRGVDSNLVYTNGHYPTVNDSGQRNGIMRKDEEEDDEDEEEEGEVPKVAQMKNRWY